MAADGVYLVDARAGLEHDVGGVYLILECDALDGAAHKRGGAAAYDHDEEIVRRRTVDELYDLLACAQALLVGERMSADIDVGAAEHVALFSYFNYRDAPRQILSQYLIYSHRHMITRLACAYQIYVALFAQIPAARADAQDAALHAGDALYALVGVELLKGLLGDIKHDPSALGVAVRKQRFAVLDLDLHIFIPPTGVLTRKARRYIALTLLL